MILNNETEVYYDGDVIPESAIESYFVWIPRYKYQIFNEKVGNYTGKDGVSTDYGLSKVINVSFETKDVEKSTGSTYQSWLTHPAFTSFETNGMWVGKFETGYKGANTKEDAQKNEDNPNKIQIKPNEYSWRGIQVVNAYLSSYNYKRDMDSHMMKNTEWGAVAYLSQSEYGVGKYVGTSDSSKSSVRINNNQSYLTGYASLKEPTCGYKGTNVDCNRYETIEPENIGKDGTNLVNYFSFSSQVASTTGNYSGIYDMSGGSWEYVMGVMLNLTNTTPCSGRDETYNSGFSGFYSFTIGSLTTGPKLTDYNSKYYDTYRYSTEDEDYNRRILEDATGEMGSFVIKMNRSISSWHDDEAWFVWSWYPWFYRGARFDHGSNGGVLAFGNMYGSSLLGRSFRVVLSFLK